MAENPPPADPCEQVKCCSFILFWVLPGTEPSRVFGFMTEELNLVMTDEIFVSSVKVIHSRSWCWMNDA